MCAEQKKDEEAIYYAAIAKPAVERDSYIKAACGDDTDLLALALALMSIFFVTPVIVRLGIGDNVTDAYLRQLNLLLPPIE